MWYSFRKWLANKIDVWPDNPDDLDINTLEYIYFSNSIIKKIRIRLSDFIYPLGKH